MKTSIDISYCPLKEELISGILDFINRLNSYKSLIVENNGMSTQVFGEYLDVMGALTKKKSFEMPHSVFVLKIISGLGKERLKNIIKIIMESL
ncbi:MAG: hypothetical protein GY834_00555 [Bacteroidetes bacterium]|nr:hypothetical protein [Bacteroidota bacterium]